MPDPRRSVVFLPLLCVAVAFCGGVRAQNAETKVSGWMRPPEPIGKLVEAAPPPSASLSPQRGWLVLVQREALPSLAVVSRPHEKLAGLRIDPATRGPQLDVQTIDITLRPLAGGKEVRVDVPAGHWSDPIWSADDRAFALLHTTAEAIELWVADPATTQPKLVKGVVLDAVLGSPVQWLPDQRRLLVRLAVPGEVPVRSFVPTGPVVQESVPGQKAQVRTFQDLLQDEGDAAEFERVGTSQLAIVDAAAGSVAKVGAPAMFDRVEASPDGSLLLVSRIVRPFSYAVPSGAFPHTTEVLDLGGKVLRVLHEAPLQENVPIGGVPVGPRGIDWVPALGHTLWWTEALDGGDSRREAAERDRTLLLDEPAGTPRPWFRCAWRSAGVSFAPDGLAVATEFDRKTRRQKVLAYDWRDASRPARLLYERSTQDAYGDPGRTVGEHFADGRSLLRQRGALLFRAGEGASPIGNLPFVDEWNVATGATRRLFQCAEGRAESFVGFLDAAGERALIRSESPADAPALVEVDVASGARRTLLQFADPADEYTRGIEKQLVKYEREDGVPLSGTLYLPPGRKPGEKLPCLVWAYPLEYAQASDAGQVRATPFRHLRLAGISHLFLLLHGYAVFDDAAMPIVGPTRTANDTFVEQVQKNARAAVAALEKTGAIDTQRLAVAGHSYGAFMTANLLAHTDLFRAGIARSGAYNRTLTPFGFQNEERTYWEAKAVYEAMSPFSHADRIHEPLLLIHGADDDNPGTFPLQSQRLFAAIKGHGGTVRLCLLPCEKHGYRARENVLQCLAEMCAWLDAHCAPRK